MQKPKFQIGASVNTANELKRSIDLQLRYVGRMFDPLQKEVGQAIHETRQTCKKCRAMVRLIRDSMGYAAYYRENSNLRDLQRELARLRDADVQQQLFSRLSKKYPGDTGKSWFSGLLEDAKINYNQQLDHFLEGNVAAQISDRARKAAASIKTYELSGQGFSIIEGGLTRIYRQGREMGTMVFSDTAGELEVHNLRKKAKYLQYQLSYLSGVFEALFTAMSRTLETLTENLGYFNDLYLACNRIEEYAEANDLRPEDHGSLLDRLREEMQQLKSDSLPIYVNIYSEPTRAFIRRTGGYWESYYSALKHKGKK